MRRITLLKIMLLFIAALLAGVAVAEDNLCDFEDVSIECVEFVREAAEQGYAIAQFGLGSMYYNGMGVVKDEREAFRWYLAAAEQGHVEAQAILGAMYYAGEGVAEDNHEAYIWLSIANINGDKEVEKILVEGFWEQLLTPAGIRSAKHEVVRRSEEIESRKNSAQNSDDYETGESDEYSASLFALNSCLDDWKSRECVELIHESAEQGDAEAQYILGLMYYNGGGVVKDEREAYIWFSIANANGNKEAEKILLEDFWKRFLTPAGIRSAKHEVVRRSDEIEIRKNSAQNSDTAQTLSAVPFVAEDNPCDFQDISIECVEYTRERAEQGDVDAQYNIGVMYNNGKGVARDDHEAFRWFRAAAKQGNAEAQFNIGVMYQNGEGVVKDYGEAFRWYFAAAEQEVAEAQLNLGAMYYKGEGVARDDREAFRWFRVAAKQGVVKAQFNLGLMYENGEGVAMDYSEAFRWFRMAAEQEHAKAQFNLGGMYYKGEGVAKDDREAFRWIRAAAEQGHAKAQNNLGWMYNNGEGVAQDYGQALLWYTAAAWQGLADAQYNLGAMFVRGEDVMEVGRKVSYTWFLIAKASGSKEAEKSLQKFPWQQYLTSAEIKSAKREAIRRSEEIKNHNNSVQNSNNGSSQKFGGEYVLAKPPKQKNIAAEVFENTWRSVVMIEDSVGQGGGVVISPNFVATNCHVIEGGEIVVYKPENGRIKEDVPFDAKVVHRNELHDFCILEVEGLWAIPVRIRKYETLQVGEGVYALGAPQGLDLSLSEGLISQLRKSDEGKRFIQTDAAISPGSSGGGLFDVDGSFIGILTGKNTDEGTEGIGFAIPADLSLEFL